VLLSSQGFSRVDETIVQTLRGLPPPPSGSPNIELLERFSDGWFEGFCACSGIETGSARTTARQLLNLIAPEVVASILGRARERGAGTAYLQVVAENQNAIALYAKLGFRDAYRYFYRVRSLTCGQ